MIRSDTEVANQVEVADDKVEDIENIEENPVSIPEDAGAADKSLEYR